MNLQRCEKGHFYDMEKYASCPQCSGEAGGLGDIFKEEMETTISYANAGQGVTIPATDSYRQTVPAEGYGKISDSEIQTNTLADLVSTASGIGITQPAEDMGVTWRYSPTGITKAEPTVGWLVCLTGENAGESYKIKAGRNFIGRLDDMDIVLTGDNRISRSKHAIILYEPRRREFMVQPGESRELFYVNDEVVLDTVKLQAYDKLLIGSTELYFVPFCGEKFAWEDLENKDE